MRNVIVFILFILCAFVAVSSSQAYDDLIFLTGHAKVGNPGTARIALGIRYSTADEMYSSNSKKYGLTDYYNSFRVPLWGNYNIIDNLQTFAILPIISVDDGSNSESGISDIWLGAKYAVMSNGLLTIRAALDVPTGKDKENLGNAGGVGLDLAGLTEQEINGFIFRGQLGIRYNNEDDETDFKPGLGLYANGHVRYRFSDQLRGDIFITYFNQSDGKIDRKEISNSQVYWLEIGVGGSYKITKNLWIYPTLQHTVIGNNICDDLGIGLYIGYDY